MYASFVLYPLTSSPHSTIDTRPPSVPKVLTAASPSNDPASMLRIILRRGDLSRELGEHTLRGLSYNDARELPNLVKLRDNVASAVRIFIRQKRPRLVRQFASLLAASFDSQVVRNLCSTRMPLEEGMVVTIQTGGTGFDVGQIMHLGGDRATEAVVRVVTKPSSFTKRRFVTLTERAVALADVCVAASPDMVVVQSIDLTRIRYVNDVTFSLYSYSRAALHAAHHFPGAPVTTTVQHTRITRSEEWENTLVRTLSGLTSCRTPPATSHTT